MIDTVAHRCYSVFILTAQRGQFMQQVNILQLQGTGEDEYAWAIADVFATYEEAVEGLTAINADYEDAEEELFKLDDNARIEVWDVVDMNWGY